jgi:hypothetical protein
VLEGGRAFLCRGSGLAFESEFQHLLRENLANADDQVFEFRQPRAPLGALGAPELVSQIFGDALDVNAYFFYFLTPLFVACHPWLLLEVAANSRKNSSRESTTTGSCQANHVLHPLRTE